MSESLVSIQPTRRNFLKGMAVGIAGVAGAGLVSGCGSTPSVSQEEGGAAAAAGEETPSFLVKPDPIPEESIAETLTTEVLIIGGATGGSFTASSCVENGLQVIMVEKNAESRQTGRDYGLVNPKPCLDAGLPELDPYTLTRDHIEKSGHRVCGDVVYRFMSRSGEAGDWFFDKAAGWGLHPEVQEYSSKSDFYKNYTHVINLYPEEGRTEDRYAVMRTVLDNLAQEVIDAGGQYLTETEAVELIQAEDGSIGGAICRRGDGTYVRIEASKATVLATGDYGADEEMFNYYTEFNYADFEWPESTGLGEGHKLGIWAGAQMQPKPQPVMLFKAYCYHYLRVNKYGRRYVNEDSGYEGTVVSQLRQPDHISWAVWDSKWPEEIPASLEYGGGMAWDQDFRPLGAEWTAEREEETAFSWERDEDEILFQADTLEELADVMGFDAESKQTFLETVAHYNELVEAGVDPDFGKRPELLKISSITEPPFFALHMATEFGVTVGGLMTDVEGNVLDESGRGIPGLYAIGTVTGTLFGVDYNETTVPGISLGRNLTFGWLMGKHLATL